MAVRTRRWHALWRGRAAGCLAVIGALLGVSAYAGEVSGPDAIRLFVAEAPGLEWMARADGMQEISRARTELRLVRGDDVFAVAAVQTGERAPLDLAQLCEAALIRPELSVFTKHIVSTVHRKSVIEQVVRIAAGEARLRDVRMVASGRAGGWHLQACRIAARDLVVREPTSAEAERYLALASYAVAKELVRADQPAGVADLVEETRRMPDVHANAVMLKILSLLRGDAPEADRVAESELRLDRVTDLEVLLMLSKRLLAFSHWELAADLFERCLAIDPAQVVCAAGLSTVGAAEEARNRAELRDFEAMMSQ